MSFTVRDEGPGFSGSKAEPLPGNGIGLRIVKQLIRRMGGCMHISDRVGGGAEVEVWLPIV